MFRFYSIFWAYLWSPSFFMKNSNWFPVPPDTPYLGHQGDLSPVYPRPVCGSHRNILLCAPYLQGIRVAPHGNILSVVQIVSPKCLTCMHTGLIQVSHQSKHITLPEWVSSRIYQLTLVCIFLPKEPRNILDLSIIVVEILCMENPETYDNTQCLLAYRVQAIMSGKVNVLWFITVNRP